jgi:hypothetical protein
MPTSLPKKRAEIETPVRECTGKRNDWEEY